MNTNFGLKKHLSLYVGKSFANPLYLGLMYSSYNEGDSNYNEPTVASYERVLINNATTNSINITNVFGNVDIVSGEAVVTNNQRIVFNETYNEQLATEDKTEPWVIPNDENKRFIRYVGLFDSKTGGNLLDFAEITTPLKPGYVGNDSTPSDWVKQTTMTTIRVGGLVFKLKNATD